MSYLEVRMNIYSSFGVVIGLIVGLIIAVICFKYANTNHKAKTEYDERQKVIRGQAYMYGFYTVLVFECLMLVISIGRLPLPVDEYILHFMGIILGCTVLAVYSIWHDVYWGLNNNRRRYSIVFIICAAINAIPVIASLRTGTLIVNSKPSSAFINLLVLIMLLILAIELLIKQIADKKEEGED